MADEAQLLLLKQGVDAWNEWRDEHLLDPWRRCLTRGIERRLASLDRDATSLRVEVYRHQCFPCEQPRLADPLR
jgi:hypothetical protein